MLDVLNIKYKVKLVKEDGTQLDITDAVEDLGWEENEGELAMRITVSIRNLKYDGKYISSTAKLGCIIIVSVKTNVGNEEVARGTIVDWESSIASSKDSFRITCYDDLYNLQQSQDNIYYASGTGTKTAIKGIFKKWNIPIATYDGPDKSHGKLVYKTEALSDVILDILDDATKDGSKKTIIRSTKGKISFLKRGSNSDIYCFTKENTSIASSKLSTAGMVTKVKVIGQDNKDGKSSQVAVVDGKTEYGIRQKIYVKEKAESLSDAKDEAEKILKEKGKVKRNITVESFDVPFVRKGDKVQVKAGTLNSDFYVLGVRHNAKGTMMMDLEKVPDSKDKKDTTGNSDYKVGDAVILNGPVYVDSYKSKKGKTFKNHNCKITRIVDLSRPCPYHVDVIGWVEPGSIKKK